MLDSSEARAITEIALAPEAGVVRPYLEHISSKIRAAAEKAERQISHPFAGMSSRPSSKVRAAIQRACQTLGYQWTDHPDPDPDSPTSAPYTTISW